MSAIGAVDMALWDIKGKALNTPVYNLLGGKSRDGVLVYCHAFGKDIDAALEDVAHHKDLGYRAIRVQSGIAGLKATYGVAKGPGRYEPAERGLPSEYEWETRAVSAVRAEALCPRPRDVRRRPLSAARLSSSPHAH